MIALRPYFIDSDDYERVRFLGKGGCGEVYLSRERTSGCLVAVKFLYDIQKTSEQRSFVREVSIPIRLNLPGIVKLIGFRFPRMVDADEVIDDSARAQVVTEFMPNGDFNQVLTALHKNSFPPKFGPTEVSRQFSV
jgi:serine/threonine protein kinase